MAITQETAVNQIEVTESNDVQIRIELRIKNGEEVVSTRWHRTSFDRNMPNSVDLQMAEVNKHLIMMNEVPVSPEDIARIKVFADAAWKL